MVGAPTTFVSIGSREASEVLEKAEKHAAALERLGSRWARPVRSSSTSLRLASGAEISSVPSTSGGRGRSGNIFLDELAYYEHPEAVWDGAAGAVTHGFKLRGASTPNGVGNLFYKLWTEPKAHAGYRLHRVTIDQAREAGLSVDLQMAWKQARGDSRVFDQLFRCVFLDADAQYIPTELVDRAFVDAGKLLSPGDRFAGIDVGRKRNLTVLIILTKGPDGVCRFHHMETRGRTSDADFDALAAIAFGMGVRRLCIDATGMGAFPADRIKKKYGEAKVEALDFTLNVKEDLATGLFSAFSEQKLLLPKKEAELRDDVCAIRRIITAAGNVRYDAPNTDEGHADRAWALALAYHAALSPEPATLGGFAKFMTDVKRTRF